jgi:hypothetical protein
MTSECDVGLQVVTRSLKAKHVAIAEALESGTTKLRESEGPWVGRKVVTSPVVDEQYGGAAC